MQIRDGCKEPYNNNMRLGLLSPSCLVRKLNTKYEMDFGDFLGVKDSCKASDQIFHVGIISFADDRLLRSKVIYL